MGMFVWGMLARLGALVGCIALMLGLLAVVPASASNVAGLSCSPPNDVCRANNSVHWFAYSPTFGPDDVAALEYVRTGDLQTTVMSTSNRGVGVGDSTDWDVYAEKCPSSCMLTPDADGQVRCHGSSTIGGNVTCFHWHLRFNVDDVKNYGTGTLRMLACHEMGHTVGLEHTVSSPNFYRCMEAFTSNRTHWSLGNHNRNHINGAY